MELTLKQIKKDQRINTFIEHTDTYLKALGYNDHAHRHLKIVSDRARQVAKIIGLNKKDQELAAISAWCHDMGNFMGRSQHHYWGAMLFSQCYINQTDDYESVTKIIKAIASHDKDELKIVDKMTACVIIADKSDVHRSRVLKKSIKSIKEDIHDRVNYAVTGNQLSVNKKSKIIMLSLTLDTKFTDMMDYFSIFIGRMNYCQKAADYLGYEFKLKINKTILT
jgi:uncharacterized protein